MKAMEVLMDEHRVIERVLNVLETGADLLESGAMVKPELLLSATEFMRGYADGYHHAKEEGILFTHLEQQGFTTQGCPLGVMLAEHECGRQYTRALISAAQDIQKGNMGGVKRAIQSSRSYVALLRQHIFKEDTILFPMSVDVIPAEKHEAVLQEFDQIDQAKSEEGLQEKYLALAKSLEEEIRIV